MDGVIFVGGIFARQLQDDLCAAGMAENEVGDLFLSRLINDPLYSYFIDRLFFLFRLENPFNQV